jgi:hypothetical protein
MDSESQTADSAASDPPGRRILLHVVSPHAEIPRLSFPDTPLSGKIRGVKSMIFDELMYLDGLSFNPSTTRQRLIFQGRPILDDNATLETVFGLEPVSHIPIPSEYC